MKEIPLMNGIPCVIEGIAYYPCITIPNEKFVPAFYEVNLAVSDEVFDMFKSRGYMSCFPAGDRKYTLDPVIAFKKFAYHKDGSPNSAPTLVDSEGKEIDINIGNGSKIKVQWKHIEYKGKGPDKVKRAELVAAQIIEIVEWDGDKPATRNEEPSLEF